MGRLPSFLLRYHIVKRVGQGAANTDFKVEVIAGGIAGAAHIANNLTGCPPV